RRLVELVDLYPTVAELCRLPASTELEGLSFRPLLEAPTREWKKAAFSQVRRGACTGRTARTERWRYTEWDNGKEGMELYDHDGDPQECHNLTADPARAGTLDKLGQLLRAGWRAALPA